MSRSLPARSNYMLWDKKLGVKDFDRRTPLPSVRAFPEKVGPPSDVLLVIKLLIWVFYCAGALKITEDVVRLAENGGGICLVIFYVLNFYRAFLGGERNMIL